MIEQTRFLSTVFLCRELKLDDIYSGVNFICRNLFLRIAGKTEKNRKNQIPQKFRATRYRFFAILVLVAIVVRFPIVVIQKFWYHGNVTSYCSSLFSSLSYIINLCQAKANIPINITGKTRVAGSREII